MPDQESNVAILAEWKKDHQEEHKDIWGKFKLMDERHLAIVQALAELKMHMAVFAGLGTLVGTFIAQILARYLVR